MAHLFPRHYHFFFRQTVKFYMISNEFLNQRYGSSRHKSTEESSDADNKRKQIAGTERTLQDHQGDDKQRLKDIVPRSETENWKRCAEDERHGGNC